MPDHLKKRTKRSKAGLTRKMEKRGYTLTSTSPSGKTTKKPGTIGGRVVKTLPRTSVYTKPRKKKPPRSRPLI